MQLNMSPILLLWTLAALVISGGQARPGPATCKAKGRDVSTPARSSVLFVEPVSVLYPQNVSEQREQEEISAPGGGEEGGSYWYEDMRHGSSVFGQPGYQVFRNVKDYGAVGDGITDDTDAISRAGSEGGRCGERCGSSTTHPAVVYFPAGTYLISRPIIQYYNTQFIGNPNAIPTLKATPSFEGIAMIDSNYYIPGQWGDQWYIPQNNFYRQIRNLRLDLRDMREDPESPPSVGIHWQVAQATSLQNIEIVMSQDPNTTQIGIFMENGSGGFMGDLWFVGGAVGLMCGSQQFTSRNLKFKHCKEAIQMIWDWGWTWHGLNIFDCNVGINIAEIPPNAEKNAIGAISVLDSVMINVKRAGILGTEETNIMLDNVRFEGTPVAVELDDRPVFEGGDILVDQYGFGAAYRAGQYSPLQDQDGHPQRLVVDGRFSPDHTKAAGRAVLRHAAPPGLGGLGERYFARSKPQYENVGPDGFLNVQDVGAIGDGVTDDTLALSYALWLSASKNLILYFPQGTYIVTDTIFVPAGVRMVGEIWPQIMGTGARFSDISNPVVMVKVGNEGDVGSVEISDLLFTVRGGTAGAVLMEWNLQGSSQGAAAMWDAHFRVGGAKGSDLQTENCPKFSGRVSEDCIAATMLLHLTESSSAYLENVWPWVADHDLDLQDQTQIDIFVGRGLKVDSKIATWLWAVAPEHCVLYQVQFSGAENVFASILQTETPYFQSEPPAPEPFSTPIYSNDPTFSECGTDSSSSSSSLGGRGPSGNCAMAWGLMIVDSANIFIYGAGLYSWFQKYIQEPCVGLDTCQRSITLIKNTKNLWLFNLFTKGSERMIEDGAGGFVPSGRNLKTLCAQIVAFMTGDGGLASDDDSSDVPAAAAAAPADASAETLTRRPLTTGRRHPATMSTASSGFITTTTARIPEKVIAV